MSVTDLCKYTAVTVSRTVEETQEPIRTLHPTHEYRLAKKPDGEVVLQRLFWSSELTEQGDRSSNKLWVNEKTVSIDSDGVEIETKRG